MTPNRRIRLKRWKRRAIGWREAYLRMAREKDPCAAIARMCWISCTIEYNRLKARMPPAYYTMGKGGRIRSIQVGMESVFETLGSGFKEGNEHE